MSMKPERKEFDVFDCSSDGFQGAKRYLLQMGVYDDFINNEPDVNGFSVVNYANELFRNNNMEKANDAD